MVEVKRVDQRACQNFICWGAESFAAGQSSIGSSELTLPIRRPLLRQSSYTTTKMVSSTLRGRFYGHDQAD
jgi:hypothetical protein